jgi:GT2 family glycosyltransferase
VGSIAAIIPTLGRMFWVNQLVLSLLHGSRTPEEIIVVDQTPEVDRSPISYKEMEGYIERKGVKYIFSQEIGAAHARNVGARAARSDTLVFLDDDIFVPEYFLEEYAKLFQDSRWDAATGMILVHTKDDGTFKPLVQQESVPMRASMLRGGNFGIRRSVFMHYGGMDERFIRASNQEDWDLAWRLHKGHCSAVWSPGPWCYHAATGEGGGRSKFFEGDRDRAYNVAYFHLRHPEALGGKASLLRHMGRQFVLNKTNLLRPWRLPTAVWLAARAFWIAATAAKAGPLLPLQAMSSGEPSSKAGAE